MQVRWRTSPCVSFRSVYSLGKAGRSARSGRPARLIPPMKLGSSVTRRMPKALRSRAITLPFSWLSKPIKQKATMAVSARPKRSGRMNKLVANASATTSGTSFRRNRKSDRNAFLSGPPASRRVSVRMKNKTIAARATTNAKPKSKPTARRRGQGFGVARSSLALRKSNKHKIQSDQPCGSQAGRTVQAIAVSNAYSR